MKSKIKVSNLSENFKKRLLDGKFYKLEFNLEDSEKDIYDLTYLSSLSNFSAVDINLNSDFIYIAEEALNNSSIKARELEINNYQKPLLFISLETSSNLFLRVNFEQELEALLDTSFDVFELHVDYFDINSIKNKIYKVTNIFQNKLISLNCSRKKLSNANIVEIIKSVKEFSKNKLIIEVDGISNQRNSNKYNQTLQTISTADIVNKQLRDDEPKYKNVPLILSGGTNQSTSELAIQCSVPFNGISINSSYLSEITNETMFNFDRRNELILSINYLKKFFNLNLI